MKTNINRTISTLMEYCTNHSVRMLSSETIYASNLASLQTLTNISKEIYTYGCLHCGYRKEIVYPKTKKSA